MDGNVERSGRERAVRLLVAGLAAAVLVNIVFFVREQRGDDRLRMRRALDVETLAERSPSRAVRYHHGTYYRLARELHGATVHMDARMAERHRWVLEGLGDIDVKIARRPVQLGGTAARPLIDAATWTSQLDGRKLNLLADPAWREYVMAWVGKGERARILVAPVDRFRAAGGKL
jgi:hypothetical protein